MSVKFGMIGGDRRQAELAKLLDLDGQKVCTCGLRQWWSEKEESLETTAAAEVVVLPLPLCWKPDTLNYSEKNLPMKEVFRLFHPDQLLFAGGMQEEQLREAESFGLQPIDYFDEEELTVANAIPTAEGAIQLAMEELPFTLCGSRTVVLGYGRIGKVLTRQLKGLGAKVFVVARSNEARVWAEMAADGAVPFEKLGEVLKTAQVVFNTVPAPVMQETELKLLPKECFCLDVATVPGFNFDAAARLGLRSKWARGIPGKLAPVTAAAAIQKTIYHLMEKRGVQR